MRAREKGAGGPRPHYDNGYDAELVNADAVAVCDHYLNERRREGRRYVYRCPDCGKLDFEVEPVKGLAGCFNPACSMPKTTNALGIISHLEGLEPRGSEFIRCMEKGYEILGLAPPSGAGLGPAGGKKAVAPNRTTSDGSPAASGTSGRGSVTAGRGGSSARQDPQQDGSNGAGSRQPLERRWVRQNGTGLKPGDSGAETFSGPGSDGLAGADRPPEERPGRPARPAWRVYPIEAYFEGPNGEQIPTEAVIIEDAAESTGPPEEDAGPMEPIEEPPPEEELTGPLDHEAAPEGEATVEPPRGPEEGPPGDDPNEARRPDPAGPRTLADERELRHAVYERLLALCPLEERDARFFEGRGLDRRTVEEGRFGSISARRSRWVVERLREIFGEEELLRVPGFYRPERGPRQVRFSLCGDYALIPYHDAEGYITTVEGRLIGEPKNGRDKKYKALLGSGVHL